MWSLPFFAPSVADVDVGEQIVGRRRRRVARTLDRVSTLSAPVTVNAGQGTEVQLTVDTGTILLVRVTDKSGADVRATVSVIDEHDHEVHAMISYNDVMASLSEGFSTAEQRLGPLPPGRYTVTAVADDGRKVRKPVNLGSRPERKLRLRLK